MDSESDHTAPDEWIVPPDARLRAAATDPAAADCAATDSAATDSAATGPAPERPAHRRFGWKATAALVAAGMALGGGGALAAQAITSHSSGSPSRFSDDGRDGPPGGTLPDWHHVDGGEHDDGDR